MKLYTKGGDGGTTSLIGGERAAKFDIRVEAYGSVDELSAQTAMLRDRLAEAGIADFEEDLVTILRRLMAIESLLALGEGYEGDKVPDLSDEEIAEIERRIDAVSELLTPQLATVRFDTEYSGKCCARTILRMIRNEEVQPIQYVNYTFIEGESVCTRTPHPSDE